MMKLFALWPAETQKHNDLTCLMLFQPIGYRLTLFWRLLYQSSYATLLPRKQKVFSAPSAASLHYGGRYQPKGSQYKLL